MQRYFYYSSKSFGFLLKLIASLRRESGKYAEREICCGFSDSFDLLYDKTDKWKFWDGYGNSFR